MLSSLTFPVGTLTLRNCGGCQAPATFAIEPVRATRTFEAAIEHLTEAIERAGLRTGDRLPNEGVLAEQLGISKPTLRQALRVLELSGLVEVRRGKSGGIFVVTDLVPAVAIFTAVKLEEEAAIDVLRARRVLERAVVARGDARRDRRPTSSSSSGPSTCSSGTSASGRA